MLYASLAIYLFRASFCFSETFIKSVEKCQIKHCSISLVLVTMDMGSQLLFYIV